MAEVSDPGSGRGPQLVAGVDSSTQSTKVVLRRLDTGEKVAQGRAAHPPTEPPVSEQHPASWWSALVEAFAAAGPLVRDVAAVAVSGQQHGLVVLDDSDEVIRPAKLWNDTTSAPQAEWLVAERGARWWAQACGVVPVPSVTVTKLAWLAEHEPETTARIARLMLPHDYLTWRLSGRHVTDRGDASGTGWWDAGTETYQHELLAAAGVGRDLEHGLPEVLGPTQAVGIIQPEAAHQLGLRPEVIIGPGTGDNMAASLGLGLRPGEVALSLGTSGTAFAVAEHPTRDPSGLVAGFADATGRFLPLACTLNATKVSDTIGMLLGLDHAELAELAQTAAMGSAGAALVPWFDGERTPNVPDATGLLTGLRPGTGRAELARAVHEGVLCNLLEAADALAAATPDLKVAGSPIFLVGGGARSVAYQQILSDLHQAPVRLPDDDEAPATGAAVQAAAVLTAAVEGVAAEDPVGQASSGKTGAVAASAVLTGAIQNCRALDQVIDRWALRAGGRTVEPDPAVAAAAQATRAAYRAAASAARGLAESGS